MFQIILAHFNMKKDDQRCELRRITHSLLYTQYKYTIWSILCEASCHHVIMSSGHKVIR